MIFNHGYKGPPWEVQPNEGPDSTGTDFEFNLRFPGQYCDAESGLHYNYYRDYEPGTGRYVESDPIGLDGGISTYSYANMNPIRYYDPEGLSSAFTNTLPWAGGSAAVDGPLPVGDAIGLVLLAGAVIYDMCTETDEELEKRCEENFKRDMETCKALGKRKGKTAFKICEQQAMARYSNCLSGRDDGIDAPLPPWGESY